MSTPEVMRPTVATRTAMDLSCPECQGDDISITLHRERYTNDVERAFIMCHDCGLETEGRTERIAREEWGDR